MSEMLKRPQDESLDGKGWTYRNCEHGGDEPDTMPQAIEATDPSGVTAIYAYYKPPASGPEGATPVAWLVRNLITKHDWATNSLPLIPEKLRADYEVTPLYAAPRSGGSE